MSADNLSATGFSLKIGKLPARIEAITSPRKGSCHAVEQATAKVVAIVDPLVKKLETQGEIWTRPTTDSLVGGVAADLVKSKEQLIMENALLRQQVIVLKRQVARPQLTAKDRSLLVVLASRVKDWKNALQIV